METTGYGHQNTGLLVLSLRAHGAKSVAICRLPQARNGSWWEIINSRPPIHVPASDDAAPFSVWGRTSVGNGCGNCPKIWFVVSNVHANEESMGATSLQEIRSQISREIDFETPPRHN